MSPVKTNVLVSLTEWRRDLGTGHGGACNVEKTELGAHFTVNYFPKLKNVSGTKKKLPSDWNEQIFSLIKPDLMETKVYNPLPNIRLKCDHAAVKEILFCVEGVTAYFKM